MNKSLTPSPKVRKSQELAPKPKPRKQATIKSAVKANNKSNAKRTTEAPTQDFRLQFLLIAVELIALVMITIFSIVVVLGNAANWFSGTSIWGSLVPFAAGVLALILASTVCLLTWWKLRGYFKAYSRVIAPILAVGLMLAILFICGQDLASQSVGQFRTLVGGKEEASRVTLNHQVFAAYRRYSAANLNKMMLRAESYNSAIAEAADEFNIDQNLLQGIAATESSFKPRDSNDGGHGLFQITAVPNAVLKEAKEHLQTDTLSLYDHRHNAFIAAATFKHYLADMRNDVFLGLLAYNIGPANGGLRFIMKKYGVTDFITIQPYLQLLPRDYYYWALWIARNDVMFRRDRMYGENVVAYAKALVESWML